MTVPATTADPSFPVESSLLACLVDVTAGGRNAAGICRLSEDHPVFAGHFPQMPVLPAVIQLALVRLLLERCTGVGLRIASVGKTKFSAVIKPMDTITLSLQYDQDDKGDYTCSFNIACNDQRAATGALTLTPVSRLQTCR